MIDCPLLISNDSSPGSLWYSSSEINGMYGEMSLRPTSRHSLRTWRAVRMAPPSPLWKTGFKYSRYTSQRSYSQKLYRAVVEAVMKVFRGLPTELTFEINTILFSVKLYNVPKIHQTKSSTMPKVSLSVGIPVKLYCLKPSFDPSTAAAILDRIHLSIGVSGAASASNNP